MYRFNKNVIMFINNYISKRLIVFWFDKDNGYEKRTHVIGHKIVNLTSHKKYYYVNN